jgi:hypothetical protein
LERDLQLRLKYIPEPANAARFAADVAATAASVDGVDLDYTPESLSIVDDLIERFRGEGLSSTAIAETLFGCGCYVGEVLAPNAGGRWRDATEQEVSIFSFPMVVELPGQRVCNPIGKAFKRMENGPVDSLRYFYSVFTGPPTSTG